MRLYVFIVYFIASCSHAVTSNSKIPGCNKRYVGVRGKLINDEEPDKEINNISDDYRLEIKNTGPAVLDSRIGFTAKMFNKTGHLADSTLFLYVWNNNADFYELRKEDNFEANVTRTYSYVLPKQYIMQVCVYSKEEKLAHTKYHLVAEGTTKFTLTSSLNGNMDLKQNLSYQKNKKVLATHTPISFSVNLTDKFQSKSTSSFHWYNGETLLGHSTIPQFVFTLKEAEKMERLWVSVSTNLEEEFEEKRGEWSENIQMKDAVQWVKWNVSGGSSVDVNSLLNFTVSYTGSNPTELCWEVCEAKMNSSYCGNTTCESCLTRNKKQFDVQVGFPSVGPYHIHFRLQNDVSLQHYRTGVVHVYSTDSYSSSGYTIPIVFACLGIFILLVSSVYFVRIKRTPHVETADFDFHPSLNREEPHPIITSIKRTFVDKFFQPKHSYSSLQLPRTSARSYGSVSEDNDPL